MKCVPDYYGPDTCIWKNIETDKRGDAQEDLNDMVNKVNKVNIKVTENISDTNDPQCSNSDKKLQNQIIRLLLTVVVGEKKQINSKVH